jgi:hypothetical protein
MDKNNYGIIHCRIRNNSLLEFLAYRYERVIADGERNKMRWRWREHEQWSQTTRWYISYHNTLYHIESYRLIGSLPGPVPAFSEEMKWKWKWNGFDPIVQPFHSVTVGEFVVNELDSAWYESERLKFGSKPN